ncbi:MAG: hypothetical protein MUD17_10265 [Gemmatimonadaceae bacterium]|nr:hypothetical protein [Gemmatimonadaceae bacterium]
MPLDSFRTRFTRGPRLLVLSAAVTGGLSCTAPREPLPTAREPVGPFRQPTIDARVVDLTPLIRVATVAIDSSLAVSLSNAVVLPDATLATVARAPWRLVRVDTMAGMRSDDLEPALDSAVNASVDPICPGPQALTVFLGEHNGQRLLRIPLVRRAAPVIRPMGAWPRLGTPLACVMLADDVVLTLDVPLADDHTPDHEAFVLQRYRASDDLLTLWRTPATPGHTARERGHSDPLVQRLVGALALDGSLVVIPRSLDRVVQLRGDSLFEWPLHIDSLPITRAMRDDVVARLETDRRHAMRSIERELQERSDAFRARMRADATAHFEAELTRARARLDSAGRRSVIAYLRAADAQAVWVRRDDHFDPASRDTTAERWQRIDLASQRVVTMFLPPGTRVLGALRSHLFTCQRAMRRPDHDSAQRTERFVPCDSLTVWRVPTGATGAM